MGDLELARHGREALDRVLLDEIGGAEHLSREDRPDDLGLRQRRQWLVHRLGGVRLRDDRSDVCLRGRPRLAVGIQHSHRDLGRVAYELERPQQLVVICLQQAAS